MKKFLLAGAILAVAGSGFAAPNVTNATQKGSLLIFPDIRIDDLRGLTTGTPPVAHLNTLIRLQNDGGSDVDVICYWMDGNKNKVDFIVPVTKNQPVWFDAKSGNGSVHVNRFPQTPSNGFDNPFLISQNLSGAAVPAVANETVAPNDDANRVYYRGMLACWAVDGGAQNQVKWNHLSGTATVYDSVQAGGYEYNAYAFFVPTGVDLAPIGTAGSLNLNGLEYDSCPLYQIGQFSPGNLPPGVAPVPNTPRVLNNRLAITGCNINLNQDWLPVYTKLQFDVWNQDEVKFTGAFECADTWHETQFGDPSSLLEKVQAGGGVDSAFQNFQLSTLGTYAARYRIQGIKSTQCEDAAAKPPIVTQAVGLVAVQSTGLLSPVNDVSSIGSTLAAAGKFTGKLLWDPEGAVPEGGIR